MSSPEQANLPKAVEIETSDRFLLANAALEEVRKYERFTEVEVYLQTLLDGCGVDGLVGSCAADVPYSVYKDIGAKLKGRLIDDNDLRIVRVRDDENRKYVIMDNPDQSSARQSRSRHSFGGNLGYLATRRY